VTLVLDASVFIAALSPAERHYDRARAIYREQAAAPFVVPAIFRLEALAAFSRRGEPAEFLDAVEILTRSSRFHLVEVDTTLLDLAVSIARRTGLRAYDALYAAVASSHGVPLVTLDADLAERLGAAFPEIEIRC
jgi:predicted nucleic acid-binding protein